MKRLLFVAVMTFMVTGTANAQETPAPCGPANDLAADVGDNVAANSRCFELRMYTAEPEMNGKGGIDNLHQRFAQQLLLGVAGYQLLIEQKSLAGWQNFPNPLSSKSRLLNIPKLAMSVAM